MLVTQLLSYYGPEAQDKNKDEAYIYGGLLIFITFFTVLIFHNFQLRMMEVGARVRVAACALVYRKALKLSKSSLAHTTIGQMVNLLSNDISRFENIQHLHNLWIAPLECIVTMYLLYFYVGVTGLAGTAFLVVFMPCQSE